MKDSKLTEKKYKTLLENRPNDLATVLASIDYTKRLKRHGSQNLGDRW